MTDCPSACRMRDSNWSFFSGTAQQRVLNGNAVVRNGRRYKSGRNKNRAWCRMHERLIRKFQCFVASAAPRKAAPPPPQSTATPPTSLLSASARPSCCAAAVAPGVYDPNLGPMSFVMLIHFPCLCYVIKYSCSYLHAGPCCQPS